MVPLVQLEVPDYDLGLRGKLLRADKLTKSGRSAFCTIIYGLDLTDAVTETPLANVANGYPDGFAVPDESTRAALPWRPGTDAVIADMVDTDGAPLAEAPRSVLRTLVDRFDTLGLDPILGFEYELFVMHADDDALRERRFRDLRQFGRTDNAYELSRLAGVADLAREFVERLESIGAPVEAFHSELGPGFFEYALAPLPAIAAADAAARSRVYLRELCAERGLLATFMAKLHIDASGAGGHVHQSLRRDGANAFAGNTAGELSDLGQHYLAGLLATMPDLTVLMSPFVNSFKRPSPSMWVADGVSWAYESRAAACRVIATSGSEATRIEHRRPGADANPYLVAAAMLAGGLVGIEGRLPLAAPLDSGSDATAAPAPRTLLDAVERFRSSETARTLLGDRFVDCFAATRDAELVAFERWWSGHVSDWELSRHLDHM
jgi:glutamine synthetase